MHTLSDMAIHGENPESAGLRDQIGPACDRTPALSNHMVLNRRYIPK